MDGSRGRSYSISSLLLQLTLAQHSALNELIEVQKPY